MAKQRQENTGVSAIVSLFETIGEVAKVELRDNPEELAKVDKMVAKAKSSNLMTALALQDDAIEVMHDADDRAAAEHAAEVEEADAAQDAIERADAMDQAEEQPTEPTG